MVASAKTDFSSVASLAGLGYDIHKGRSQTAERRSRPRLWYLLANQNQLMAKGQHLCSEHWRREIGALEYGDFQNDVV
jgi:hypothetical protein